MAGPVAGVERHPACRHVTDIPTNGLLPIRVVGNTIRENDPTRTPSTAASGITGPPATATLISMNALSKNGGLGIDLLPDPPLQTYGVTINDSAGHNGPNHLQNYPIV